jgi:hypothetical protein
MQQQPCAIDDRAREQPNLSAQGGQRNAFSIRIGAVMRLIGIRPGRVGAKSQLSGATRAHFAQATPDRAEIGAEERAAREVEPEPVAGIAAEGKDEALVIVGVERAEA